MPQIQLSEHSMEVIEEQVRSGDFQSPAEVVETAIELLEWHRSTPFQHFDNATGRPLTDDEVRALIQEGLEDVANGRVGPVDAEDIKRRGRERHAQRQSLRQA
jgi:Arc/MetJ-type ribon-helix-helix transcriptional regulator